MSKVCSKSFTASNAFGAVEFNFDRCRLNVDVLFEWLMYYFATYMNGRITVRRFPAFWMYVVSVCNKVRDLEFGFYVYAGFTKKYYVNIKGRCKYV